MGENDLEGVIGKQPTWTSLEAVTPARRIGPKVRKLETLFVLWRLTLLVMSHAVELGWVLPERGGKVDVVGINAYVGSCRKLGPDGQFQRGKQFSIEDHWRRGLLVSRRLMGVGGGNNVRTMTERICSS